MRNRRITTSLPYFVWAVAALLAVNLGYRRWGASGAVSPTVSTIAPVPVSITPHLIETEEFTVDPKGRTLSRVVTVALSRDGSFVERSITHRQHTASVYREMTLGSGQYFLIDDFAKRKMTGKVKIMPEAKLRSGASNCLYRFDGRKVVEREEVVGRDRILGHDAVVVRNGAARTWFAPALTCATLKSIVAVDDGTYELLPKRILVGEPLATLFEVGPDLSEATLDEITKRSR